MIPKLIGRGLRIFLVVVTFFYLIVLVALVLRVADMTAVDGMVAYVYAITVETSPQSTTNANNLLINIINNILFADY